MRTRILTKATISTLAVLFLLTCAPPLPPDGMPDPRINTDQSLRNIVAPNDTLEAGHEYLCSVFVTLPQFLDSFVVTAARGTIASILLHQYINPTDSILEFPLILDSLGTFTIKAIVIRSDASRDSMTVSVVVRRPVGPVVPDTIPPIVTITSPTQGATIESADVTIQGRASDASGIAYVKINDSTATLGSGDGWSIRIRLVAGSNTIKAIAGDNRGHKDSASITVTYDSTATDTTTPTIARVSPEHDSTVGSASFTIRVDVRDDNGIRAVTIGNQAASAVSGSLYERAVSLAEGANHFVVSAIDASSRSNRDSTTITLTYLPVPSTPTGCIATAMDTGRIRLQWSTPASGGAPSVYTIAKSADSVTFAIADSTSGTSDTVAGLVAGTKYFFRVSAKNQSGSSAAASVSAMTTPAAPVGVVTAVLSSTSIRVSWNSVSASSYFVYRSATSGGAALDSFPSVASPYDYSGLAPNTTYFFSVKAVNGEGALSAASASVPGSTNPVAPIAPSAPSIVVQSATSIQVLWNVVTNATSYLVYKSASTNGAPIDSVVAQSPYVFNGLTGGSTYYFYVKAVGIGGTSPASPRTAGITIPAAPGSVSASADAERVLLTWMAMNGANSYNVYWYPTGTPGSVTARNGKTSPDTISGLTARTGYSFYVKAVNGSGESVESAVATATPFAKSWQIVGSVAPVSTSFPVAVSSQGVPFVAYKFSESDTNKLNVMSYTNGAWAVASPVPAISLSSADYVGYEYISLDLTPAAVPFLSTWKHLGSGGIRHVIVYSLSSGTWQQVGSTDAFASSISLEGIKLTLDGETPFMLATSSDSLGDGDIVAVRKYVGGTWQNVGKDDTATTSGLNEDMCISKNGTIFSVYSEPMGTSQYSPKLRKFTGTYWQPIGTSSDLGTNKVTAIKSSDNTVYALLQVGTTAVSVYSYNTAWTKLGTDVLTGTGATGASLAIDPKTSDLYVAGRIGSSITVKRWNGTLWSTVGSATTYVATGTLDRTSMAVDATGTPYLAFLDANNGNALTVMSFR